MSERRGRHFRKFYAFARFFRRDVIMAMIIGSAKLTCSPLPPDWSLICFYLLDRWFLRTWALMIRKSAVSSLSQEAGSRKLCYEVGKRYRIEAEWPTLFYLCSIVTPDKDVDKTRGSSPSQCALVKKNPLDWNFINLNLVTKLYVYRLYRIRYLKISFNVFICVG